MKKYAVAAVGLLALLSSCASATPAVPAGGGTPAATPPVLAGTAWTVSKIKGTDTIADAQPTMKFEASTVSGLASCNRFTGGYTLAGAELKFGALATTQMMCEDAKVMTQEQTFLAAIATVTSVRNVGDTGLELLDAQQTAAVTLVPVQNKPLEGTTWELAGVITNEAISSPVKASAVTLSIADGVLSGKACNSFSGSVKAGEDGSITVGALRSTKMACTSDELTTQEHTVLTTLEKVTSYEISGSALTLKAADGTGLEFLAG